MSTYAERQFEALTRSTITSARLVECSPSEFREGLEELIEELRMEIAASEEMDRASQPEG